MGPEDPTEAAVRHRRTPAGRKSPSRVTRTRAGQAPARVS